MRYEKHAAMVNDKKKMEAIIDDFKDPSCNDFLCYDL